MDKFDEWLDEQLRTPQPYIADEGFSKAVLARLPEKRAPRVFDRRITLILASALGGALTLALATPIEVLLGLAEYSALFQNPFLSSILFTSMLIAPLFWPSGVGRALAEG